MKFCALYLDSLHEVAVERYVEVGIALLNPFHHRALVVLIASGNELRINLLEGLLILVSDLRLLLNDFPHLVVYALNLAALRFGLLPQGNLTVVVTEIGGYKRTYQNGYHKQYGCRNNVFCFHKCRCFFLSINS